MSASNHNLHGNAPCVSVGMPVYNAGKYLKPALDAILSQTYANFELIVSDNGSTDDTQRIVEGYARSDGRIVYHREPENRGVCWNFNRVVDLAKGKYFKWAAADDVCKPSFIQQCVDVLEGDSSIVCCHTRTKKIDANGNVIESLADPTQLSTRNATANTPSRRFQDVLLSSGWSARSYGLIRLATLRRTSLIRPYYGYEKVLMSELALHGRFFDVPETLFLQRVHEDASSNLKSAAQQQAFFSPKLARRRTFPRLKLLQGYVSAIRRVPLTTKQRSLCGLYLAQYVCQFSKWHRVIEGVLLGTGNGSAGRELKTANQ